MRDAARININFYGWLSISAVLHLLIFFSVNKLFLNLVHFAPPLPLVIDVTFEAPPNFPEPVSEKAVQTAPDKKTPKIHRIEESSLPLSKNSPVEKDTRSTGTGGGALGASPQYFNNPKPPYPESARRAHKEGIVTLLVKVKSDGSVSSTEISESSGTSILDASAQQTVLQWRFVPAMLNGEPIESSVIIPIKFKLND